MNANIVIIFLGYTRLELSQEIKLFKIAGPILTSLSYQVTLTPPRPFNSGNIWSIKMKHNWNAEYTYGYIYMEIKIQFQFLRSHEIAFGGHFYQCKIER